MIRTDLFKGTPFRWLSGKESASQCRRHKRHRFDFGLGTSPGEENGNPLQDFCQENSIDRGAWQTTVHAKSQIRLSIHAHIQVLTPSFVLAHNPDTLLGPCIYICTFNKKYF